MGRVNSECSTTAAWPITCSVTLLVHMLSPHLCSRQIMEWGEELLGGEGGVLEAVQGPCSRGAPHVPSLSIPDFGLLERRTRLLLSAL